MTKFTDLNLAEPLDKALRELGYDDPTEIQSQAIPHLLKGRDLMGIAQTGTGKTAAFTLPTLHHIFAHDREPPKRGARALILAPTRELAGQITESVRQYGRHIMHMSVTSIYGGVPIQRQIKRLVGGNDVLVATPGRLIDLIDRKAVTLKDIEILILDEADQMMDMGFIHALRKIIPMLPKKRQTLFFSATMAPKIQTLASEYLTDPVKVSVTPANTTAERVSQIKIFAESPQKQTLLGLELIKPEVERALVFTRTKHGADRVVKRLAANGLQALAIHGNKSQGQRQRALDAFKNGVVNILVATDIAARGIDIDDITHVFNYEIPNVPEQYVHRIGRTARARKSGRAISLVAKDERKYLREIEKLLGEKIPEEKQPKDLDEAAKVLKARPAVEPINDRVPERRKGRGKSTKKKKARFSKYQANKSVKSRHENEPGEREAKSGYNPDAPSPKKTKPNSRRPQKMSGQAPSDSGATHRRKKPVEEASKAAGKTDRPKRKNKNQNKKRKSGEAKPKTAQDPARASSGGAGFKRKPRKSPHQRGKKKDTVNHKGGGNHPPKRRRKT